MNTIPSEKEFARASRWMKDQSRNLDVVRRRVVEHFQTLCSLHSFYIMPQGDSEFRAFIFFMTDKDNEICKKEGIHQEFIDFVYTELEKAGRGKKGDITVAFEFDSDENVDAKFDGDYFLRLR